MEQKVVNNTRPFLFYETAQISSVGGDKESVLAE